MIVFATMRGAKEGDGTVTKTTINPGDTLQVDGQPQGRRAVWSS